MRFSITLCWLTGFVRWFKWAFATLLIWWLFYNNSGFYFHIQQEVYSIFGKIISCYCFATIFFPYKLLSLWCTSILVLCTLSLLKYICKLQSVYHSQPHYCFYQSSVWHCVYDTYMLCAFFCVKASTRDTNEHVGQL